MDSKLNTRISLLVPCELVSRDAISALVEHICVRLEQEGEPEGFRYQVVSAFNEAFNNLARHGGEKLKNKEIMVVVEVNEQLIIIELHDSGKGFKFPSESETDVPLPGELRESGMGLFIMRSFMSELKYQSSDEDGVNVLRMVRNLTRGDQQTGP
jgi:anti-sigma regulatory factor (Ser/Thr protein kinase)